jgi:acyl-coenzyme A thioesterase 9
MFSLHDSQLADEILCKPGFEQTTNNFRLTWCRDGSDPLSRKVVPKTYKGKLKRSIRAINRTIC